MRYQIRMLDVSLPGLTRLMALAARRAVAEAHPEVPPGGLYRPVYRAFRDVFRKRLTANRYCGGAMSCEHGLSPSKAAPRIRHEAYPGERIRIYLVEPELTPDALVRELVAGALRGLARRLPVPPPHLGSTLKSPVERSLKDRVFRSDYCGVSPLCNANESYDPWDAREPQVGNAVRPKQSSY